MVNLTLAGARRPLGAKVAEEGALSLYKGWLPNWMRMAPWSLAFFLSFEQMRRVGGFDSF